MKTEQQDKLSEKIAGYYKLVDQSTQLKAENFAFFRDSDVARQIASMFADDAVYLRDGSTSFRGMKMIEQFFSETRSLLGHHNISDISIAPIDQKIKGFESEFRNINRSNLICLNVEGTFNGVQSFSGKKYLESAHSIEVPFTDYWVLRDDKVIYRYSNIRNLDIGRRI